MSVTLNLSPQTVQRLRDQAAQSGETVEGFLERLAEQSAAKVGGPADQRASQEWVAEWRAWTAAHQRLSTVADDSRDSIYADRDE